MFRMILIIAAVAVSQAALAAAEAECRYTTRIDDARGINFICKNRTGKTSTAVNNEVYRSCELDLVVTVGASCPETHTIKTMVTCLGVLEIKAASTGKTMPLSVKGKKPATVNGSGAGSVTMKLVWAAGRDKPGFTSPEVSRLKCSVLINDVLVN